MYSNEDFENFYVRYKVEGLPNGMSIQSWCMKNKVSWNLFNKWYRDTQRRIVPINVEAHPEEDAITEKSIMEFETQNYDTSITMRQKNL